ncbi:hypothetical protein Sjap_024275 [Stephania japonica]|uniref:Uncharacterized protein n=1 Tax=Stephania japonica TaxID=461633 RepID=A0AAP0EIF1_9MAGN
MSSISEGSIIMCSASGANNDGDDVARKSANFHPTVWGDYFLSCCSVDDVAIIDACADEVEKLKEKVRNILNEVQNEPSKQLSLIDALQRLGVAYHFETEIEEALGQMFDGEIIQSFLQKKNLHDVALCFRLLRQQGYNVLTDIFAKFKDDNGKFESSLLVDVKGMLSLYDATHIRFHGENVLEEALIFTTTNLTSIMKSSPSFTCSPLGRQVQHSLEQPIYRGVPRLEARWYISLYQENNEMWSDSVSKLAKIDFKLVQTLHRQELSDISRWWKELEFASKLSFVRDRIVECYFWSVGVYFEPSYSLARVFLAKVTILTSIVDDIFDVYGTIEELKLFTDALERWDASCINQLPGYMKIFFQAILDEYEKMEEVMNKEGCPYHVHYAKEVMKDLARSYLVEAKWYSEGHVPKLDEYLRNGLISSAYYILPVSSLVGMGRIISKEDFEWMMSAPKLLRAASIMSRLYNDVCSHQFEQERGHVASAVECYMEEFGASKQETYREIHKMIEEAGKDVNEGCSNRSTTIPPRPLLIRILNFVRMLYLIYKYGDDTYTHSETRLKETVEFLFINPVDT